VIGWNTGKAEGFNSKKSLGDVTHKVGGGKDWTKASKSGGKWVHNIYDMDASDSKEAEELALGKLRDMSFQYLRAEGSGEGNAKLSAGAEVTLKYVGKAYSGDYIAEAVTHDFSLDCGYITRFKLKRNMMADEIAKQAGAGGNSQGGNGRGGKNGGGAAASQTDEENEDEDKTTLSKDARIKLERKKRTYPIFCVNEKIS
jgi:hypothetical protein